MASEKNRTEVCRSYIIAASKHERRYQKMHDNKL